MSSLIFRIILFFSASLFVACGGSSSTTTDESGSAAAIVTADPVSFGSVQTVTSENYRAVIQQSFIPVPAINGKNLTIRIGLLRSEGGRDQ